MKSMKIKPLVLALVSIPLALSGCGGSGQDEGTTTRVPVSGLTLDGYLARALVFQDLNGNRILDPFENYAYTDDEGYFSYNPNTDTDYCTSNNLPDRQHCLNAVVTDRSEIVSQGGIDLQTGEPFKSSMSADLDIRSDRSISSLSNINPVTTLMSFTQTPAEKATILSSFNLTNDDVNRDYFGRSADNINQQTNDNSDLSMLRATQVTQKIVSSISQIADKSYAMGDEEDLPPDTSSFVYKALAQELVNRQTTSSNVIQNNIADVATRAKTLIDLDYVNKNITPPAVTQSLPTTLVSPATLLNVPKVETIVNSLVNQMTSVSDTDTTTKATTKIIDLTVAKIVNENAGSDIDNVITAVNDATLRTSLVTQMSQSSTNVNMLLNTDISDETTLTNQTTVTYDPVFADLVDKRVALGESTPAQNEDYSAVLYFLGNGAQATTGTLVACVRYIDGLNDNGTLKSGATLGTFSDKGTWSRLNDGFALMLDFEIANAKRQATIQYAGPDGQGNYIYNTDIDDELKSWTGPAVPIADFPEAVPTTDAQCQNVLDAIDPIDPAMLNRIQS